MSIWAIVFAHLFTFMIIYTFSYVYIFLHEHFSHLRECKMVCLFGRSISKSQCFDFCILYSNTMETKCKSKNTGIFYDIFDGLRLKINVIKMLGHKKNHRNCWKIQSSLIASKYLLFVLLSFWFKFIYWRKIYTSLDL